MLLSNLLSLILNYFIKNKLPFVVLFHCWNKETLYRLSFMSSQHLLYSQYINLNDASALLDFGHRFLRYNRPKTGVFMDLNCNHSDRLINESSHQHLFNYRYNWLIYDELRNLPRLYSILNNANLSVDTQLAYVVPQQPVVLHANKTTFTAFDVYNNGRFLGGFLNVTPNYELDCTKTECQNMKYLSGLHKRSLYGNREILRDVTMRVAGVVTHYDLKAPDEEIIKHLTAEDDVYNDPLNKFSTMIYMLLKDSLQAKVSYTFYNRWSDGDIKGGIVGALIDGTADLTCGPFFHTAGRFHYLTPIAQTASSRTVCMFRTPRNSGIQGRVFLDPFSTKVWIIFGAILSVCAIFLWVIFVVEFRQKTIYLEFAPSLLTTCLISFGSACAQGSFLIPRSLAGRVAFITLTLISFIMYNYYTSVVVSSLLGSPAKSKIKTLGDLADSNLDIGLEPLPYTQTYLNFSTLPVVRRFVRRKVETKNNLQSLWYSLQDGINKMRFRPGFVYIFEAQNGYILIEKQYEPHEMCDLNEIPFRSDSLVSIHLHRNSSYKEIVRLKMVRILESGLYNKHRRRYIRARLNCLSSSFLLSVGMEYAAPLFLMLLSSYFLVFVIFIMEIVWHRYIMRGERSAGNERDKDKVEH